MTESSDCHTFGAMPLILQDVKFGDGRAIANIYISAFFDDPFQRTLSPDMPFEKQVAGVISRWPNNYGDISAYYKKVVDTDSGEIVGYSKWAFAFTDAGEVFKRPRGRWTAPIPTRTIRLIP